MTIVKPKISESQYHQDMKVCKSTLGFVQDEIHFLEQLLRSYVFEPNTPNLFERIEEYKTALDTYKERYGYLTDLVNKHDLDLGGLIECETEACETAFDEEHLRVLELFDDFVDDYQKLKKEIFQYCRGVLRQHKK